MKILILGPQGSGKTTQGELLAKKLGVPLIVAGVIARSFMAEDSDEGRRAKEILNAGHLLPDTMIAPRIMREIEKHPEGFILDGFPRNENQLKGYSPDFDKVLYISVPEETSLERLIKRGRHDDSEQIIKERLQVYHRETGPILEHYRQQGKVIEINGDRLVEEVSLEIEKALSLGA